MLIVTIVELCTTFVFNNNFTREQYLRLQISSVFWPSCFAYYFLVDWKVIAKSVSAKGEWLDHNLNWKKGAQLAAHFIFLNWYTLRATIPVKKHLSAERKISSQKD